MKNRKDIGMASISTLEQILLEAIGTRELYGLAIIQAVKEASNGSYRIGVGSLYPSLHKLVEKGLLEARWGDDNPSERRAARRRYYKVTGLGQRLLREIGSFRKNLATWKPATI